MSEEIWIEEGRREDARAIGEAIVEAVGAEHCLGLIGPGHVIEEIVALFAEMAEREDTQYSYRNALVARDAAGEAVGVCLAYDGGRLAQLRRPFLARASQAFGIDPTEVTDETEPGEYYIDTLAVRADYRGRGIGRRLLMAAAERGRALGLRPGLLVDKENPRARTLYESAGFVKVGDRPFFDIVMDHMQA
ncbi:MAG: GNAT family N-acetyltransferase [Muribaculaceae bacterium]|nr:GNAT family N-acetyltransferase [Muribaculaceae bacterium]